MAAIVFPSIPIQLTGLKIPMELEGTLLAVGSDGGGNYSLMQCGTAPYQIKPCTDVMTVAGLVAPIGFIQIESDTLGVATDKCTLYGPGNVVWAMAGAAIAVGQPVMSEAATQTGRVVVLTDTHFWAGIALTAAAAEDDMIAVLVSPGGWATA